jgi:hypothetical protein
MAHHDRNSKKSNMAHGIPRQRQQSAAFNTAALQAHQLFILLLRQPLPQHCGDLQAGQPLFILLPQHPTNRSSVLGQKSSSSSQQQQQQRILLAQILGNHHWWMFQTMAMLVDI